MVKALKTNALTVEIRKMANANNSTDNSSTKDSQWIVGYHAVQSLLKTMPDNAIELHCTRARRDQRNQKTQQLASRNDIPIVFTEYDQLSELVDSNQHQGVALKIVEQKSQHDEKWLLKHVEQLSDSGKTPLVIVLDQITDPHNLGAILRSADGAGVDAVIIPRDNDCGITPVVRKVASGAVDTMPLVLVTNLSRTLKNLQEAGLWVTGLSDSVDTLYTQHDFKGASVIVMGAEGDGMRRLTQEHCDYLVQIPMLGSVSSLNVSVATGVVLYEVVRQRGG